MTSVNDYTAIKKLTVLGEPTADIESVFTGLETEPNYIDSLGEMSPDGDLYDIDAAAHSVLAYARTGGRLYVAKPVNGSERKVLDLITELRPDFVIDEAIEVLHAQVDGEPITDIDGFEEGVLDACSNAEQLEAGVEVARDDEDEDTVLFYAQWQESRPQRLKFVTDGTIELNGAVLRPVALIGAGYYYNELLGGRVLSPAEVVRFIANRVAVNGPDELCGYGRAFGPSRDDHTNASLTPRARAFRASGLCGVVSVSLTEVTKARPEMVGRVGTGLRKRLVAEGGDSIKRLVAAGTLGEENDLVALALAGDEDAMTVVGTFVCGHQQMKELYVGLAAAIAFRLQMWLDKAGKLHVKAFGKSSKHWRVDPGTYALYTDNESYLDLPAVIGQFEESNDGSVYAPLALLDSVRGYLKESVVATKNFRHMSDEAMVKYLDATMLVEEGERVAPGQALFRVGDNEHTWDSKADWGVVTKVVEIMDPWKQKRAHYEVRVNAYFEREMKLRGFGKGLVCPAEAAGVSVKVMANSVTDTTPRLIIGAPGIVKDSEAALEYVSKCEPCVAVVRTEMCRSSYEASKEKHTPSETLPEHEDEEQPPILLKRYPHGITLVFNELDRSVTTIDPHAIKCVVRVQIEASPVAQSVGSSGLTMPQIGFLGSFENGNAWLNEVLLPGVKRRTNLLGYFHAVAGQVDMNEGLEEPVGTGEADEDDDDIIDFDDLFADEMAEAY